MPNEAPDPTVTATPAESRLWFVVDVGNGVVAVATTRREAMRLAGVPTRAEWRGAGHWEHHRYGPDSEEIGWAYSGDDEMESVGIEHGAASAERQGWAWALAAWRSAGAPVGVRMDELEDAPTTGTDGCTCPFLMLGSERTEARNWDPDCPEHGVASAWYRSPEQVALRSARSRRLRDIQETARLARQLARDGVEIEDRRCNHLGVHDVHLYERTGAWYRCAGVPCDHDNLCCAIHDIHVAPHRGCLLR